MSYDGYVEGSLGKPLKDVEIRLVDGELKDVPLGNAGELIVSSPQAMTGYLGDESLTAATLVDLDGKKWIRTGDVFRTDKENHLFFLGRKKRLIKICGMNVFPAEIERVAQKLGFFKECVAIESKQDGKTMIKLLVDTDLSKEQQDEIKEYIRVKLSHWSIPRAFEKIKEFPHTAIGKIDVLKLQRAENDRLLKDAKQNKDLDK